jgi:hypothetical protein
LQAAEVGEDAFETRAPPEPEELALAEEFRAGAGDHVVRKGRVDRERVRSADLLATLGLDPVGRRARTATGRRSIPSSRWRGRVAAEFPRVRTVVVDALPVHGASSSDAKLRAARLLWAKLVRHLSPRDSRTDRAACPAATVNLVQQIRCILSIENCESCPSRRRSSLPSALAARTCRVLPTAC